MSRRIQPPWDYLHDASVPSLESYELSRLNHAANLRREIAALLDQWIEDSTQALLAREDRALPRGGPPEVASPQPQLPFDEAPSPAPPRQSERAMKLSRRTARSSSN